MPGPYSNDLRECVISARADGRSCREVARLFNVSVSSVAGWSRRHKRTGSVRPGRMGRIHGSVPDGCRDWILARVRACPQTAARRLQALLAERRRERWKRHQGRADPRKPVFIDETCVKTDMIPLRGWAPKGERLPGAGEPRPSSAPCAMTGSTRLGFSTARPTETPSVPMSKPGWSRHSAAATSPSWTLRAAARPKRCARRSGARAPIFCSFRPAAPTSIRSSRRSPSSSAGCGTPGRDAAKRSGEASATLSTNSNPGNAQTTS